MSTELSFDFFLIHANQDQAKAQELYNQLSTGHRVFLDRASIKPGSIWPIELGRALEASRIFVVLQSPHLATAHYALEEIVIAIKLTRQAPSERKVIPVRLNSEHPEQTIPYGLSLLQYLNWPHNESVIDVAAALQQELKGLPVLTSPMNSLSATSSLTGTRPVHVLHAYPRTGLVPPHLITRSIIQSFADNVPVTQAQMEVAEANAYRLEADPNDNSVTLIQSTYVPPPLYTPPFDYWAAVFTQAKRNGPRMLASLCIRLGHLSDITPQARADCEALLSYLRSMPQ